MFVSSILKSILQTGLFSFVIVMCISDSRKLHGERYTQSLNGIWQIADSLEPDAIPTDFQRRVPVPGLANLSDPPFPDVDRFISRENLANKIRNNQAPAEWMRDYWEGKIEQDRNYFWYRKTFLAPEFREVAELKINKAQFGTAVWLNGEKLGEYAGCFSASTFELDDSLRWGQENTLLIRIGAHPAVLPDSYPTGSDFEKILWTPGIYDEVSIAYSDNPFIRSVQVAPRLEQSEVVVQTVLENRGKAVSFDLEHRVYEWKSGRESSKVIEETIRLEPGETRTVLRSVSIPGARWWSPEDPFLYVLDVSTGGDSLSTRFGMREFRFDGQTKRAYLNGEVYFLRGSNITLHRFFEDPLCKDLPWNDAWVRKLLGELPDQMNWNYFRFCIGPVPDRWLEICDEVGLLIQNEFFIWTGRPAWYSHTGYSRSWDGEEMIRQYSNWMRDNWNHPSVVVWDANNESEDAIFEETVIPAVRSLDLSNRPWENSYNKPMASIDPVEDHPYLMGHGRREKLRFHMSDLESMDGRPRPGSLPSDEHAPIINEYGWLWLNRDGTPTLLTENVYAQLIGRDATARERLDLYAYLLGGKTEFWRAHRHYAGIIHFVYLTCSYPGVYTADHFSDVTNLKLEPAFADYLGEAFKPLGVYINCFQPKIKPGQQSFTVMLVNDYQHEVSGLLELSLESSSGEKVTNAIAPFSMSANGDASIKLTLSIPHQNMENALLMAVATPVNQVAEKLTVSRRWVRVE
jgi:beta-galactosidase